MNSKILQIVTLCAYLVLGCSEKNKTAEKSAEGPRDKPNIIFIMADDLGYGDIEPFGQKYIKTPNLNRLAKEGMRFTQHYAGNTVCAPSRCALMTGMHMGHAEIRGNKQANPFGQIPLSDQAVTVSSLLKKAGYNTALIGKWGLGVENSTGDPLKQGFDLYYGYLDQVLAHNSFPEYLLRNGKKEELKNAVVYEDSTKWHRGLGSYSETKIDYSQDFFISEALNFIDRQEKEPFFLYFPVTIPHDNGEAPEGFRQEIPNLGDYENKEWSRETKAYAAMISRLDRDVGKILDKLKEKEIDENALVIFTSDNGPMPNVEFTNFFNSNGIFKGGKRDLYEGGIRVPLIARWPGKIKPNTTSAHISAFWDFLPTACDLASVSPPKNVDGISFLPALLGEKQTTHDYLYWEFPEQGYSVAMRKGKWKAIRRNMAKDSQAPIELYNLEVDPGEKNNVAEDFPQVVAELENLLKSSRNPSEEFPIQEGY
ncbi:arylsulfatase [Galbibacter sp. BG1]|uniref:arylsulfatase n=1 Tax=Galbibacter sp. BG1 TaxID=1170699 RepID=UPI0015B9DF70|nr:arylsulfatase [Galbibacter sp. BG1]QLE01716.1 arylsulfatase [Galbibacter sp. BG1]